MDLTINPDAIRTIHAQPEIDSKVVIALAGNGTVAVSELMRHGRASATVLAQHLLNDAHGAAMARFIGGKADRAVSEWTARQMAMAAYNEARSILAVGNDTKSIPVGIASTGALVKPDGEREGRKHVFHVAVQTPTITRVTTYDLPAGQTRETEEYINALAILQIVAEARVPENVEVGVALDPEIWMHDHEVEYVSGRVECNSTDETFKVMHGYEGMTLLVGDHALMRQPVAVLSGSFNPLHEGHVKMAEHAAKVTRRPVVFELSIANMDKPPLDYVEIRNRADQFRKAGLPLVITNRPKFMEKSQVFAAGTIFVIGVDTYDRLGDEKYYKDGFQYAEAMRTFVERENQFMVFPRRTGTGQIKGAANSGWHDTLFNRAIPVHEDEFLMDISSTELRKKGRE